MKKTIISLAIVLSTIICFSQSANVVVPDLYTPFQRNFPAQTIVWLKGSGLQYLLKVNVSPSVTLAWVLQDATRYETLHLSSSALSSNSLKLQGLDTTGIKTLDSIYAEFLQGKDTTWFINRFLNKDSILFLQSNNLHNSLSDTALVDSSGYIKKKVIDKMIYRYTVGESGRFKTIASAVEWLKTNMTGETELLLYGGNFYISDTIGILLPYKLVIRGLNFQITKINASTGLSGKPMFNVRSSVDFERITFDGSTLPGYGNSVNENCINVIVENAYCELTNLQISRFKKGINVTGGSSIFVFNSIIDSCMRGVEINSEGSAKLDIEIVTIQYCGIGINFLKSSSGGFDIISVIFKNSSADTAIVYNGTSFTYTGFPSMIASKWNGKGIFTYGFDFSLASGRDRNIYIKSNIGDEDKTPHAKINFTGGTSQQTFTANVWQKLNFSATSNYTCKFKIESDSITYQPSYKQDIMMWVSGAIKTTSQQSNIIVSIIKNHVTSTPFGQMSVTLDQNNRSFNFSTNVYIPEVKTSDVFSIWIQAIGNNEDLILTDLDWLVKAQ